MNFGNAIRNLTNGKATKRPSMRGYVAREDVESPYDPTETYAIGNKATYNGATYTAAKASSDSDRHYPNDTEYWTKTSDTIDYKLVFIKRGGTRFVFFMVGTGTSATNLTLSKELVEEIISDDWEVGNSADYARVNDNSSTEEW